MTRPRLALLNAAHGSDLTRRNFRRELDADLVEFDAAEGELPETFEFDGVVVTGSRASVYWDEPWIDDLTEWLRESVDRGLPHLGVCYGHQALAAALGGRVEPMDGFEIGYREVERVGDSRLLSDLDDRFVVFESHGDAVVELPPGAVATAENDRANQGFELGRVLTVQFHPEFDTETSRRVIEGKEFLDEERADALLAELTEENYARASAAKRLFDSFTGFVREVREAEAAAD